MALQSMPGEQVWKPAHAMEFEKDKENADTPSKRAVLGDGPLKSPASNAKRRPLSYLGGSATKQKPAKRARKSMGRRVSFAPDQRLEQTHFYEREAASSPLPHKTLEAMAARVNGVVADDAAPEPEVQLEQAAPLPGSPAPSSVDMELTGVSDYGACEMSGPLPRFSDAALAEAAAADATGTDITAAAAAQWAALGMLGDDTEDAAVATAAKSPACANAPQAEVDAAAAQPLAPAAEVAVEAAGPASPPADAASALMRRLSGSPDSGSVGASVAPGVDTPTRDLSRNITAALGGLSTLLEEDEEWQSSSCSRSAAHSPGRQPGEDTTVHQLGALPGSPGDGDVSMELTNMYAAEPEAPNPAAAEPLSPQPAAEVPSPAAEGASQPAAMPPAADAPADGLPESAAAPEAGAADHAAADAEAAPPLHTSLLDEPAQPTQAPAADPYELPYSPAAAVPDAQQAQASPEAAQQPESQTEPDMQLDAATAEAEVPSNQFTASAAAAASSQLGAGSPPRLLDSPQRASDAFPQASGQSLQDAAAALQSAVDGSPMQSGGYDGSIGQALSLSPAQLEQRDKWGCVPGADYTQDLDLAANARGMMRDRTFNEVYGAGSDADDSVTGPAAAGTLDSPMSGGMPTGMDNDNRPPLADLAPCGDTPSGATSGWGGIGNRRDSVTSRRSSRSSFGGTDNTGHLLDMDMDEPLEGLDFQDSPSGVDHFPSPGVPAGADGNTGNLLALQPEDFGGASLDAAMQRLRGSQQSQPIEEFPAGQPKASGLGRTASTGGGGGATAALLQVTGHTHSDLMATPQPTRPSPGTARKTNGTTAHLLDFTAASANVFAGYGQQPDAARRASIAGSLMDDDMQLTDMVQPSQHAPPEQPMAAASGADASPAPQQQSELSQGMQSVASAEAQAPTPRSVGSLRRASAAPEQLHNAALELQAQEQSPYWVPSGTRPSPIMAQLPAGGSIFPGGELLTRTPVRTLDLQPQQHDSQQRLQRPSSQEQMPPPPPSASPVVRPQQASPVTQPQQAAVPLPAPDLTHNMLQTPASAPRSAGHAAANRSACPPLMAIAFPTPPSVAPGRTHPGMSLMDASPAAAMLPLGDVTNTDELAGGNRVAQTPKGPSALGGRTPRGNNAPFRPAPATPCSVLRRGLMLTPRQAGAGGGPALTRPLALAEICARVDIQLHEHMRVPRPSLGGNLGIDAPPADLKEALQQRAREVDIAHVEESRAVLEGVVARLRESLAAKDAAVLAAQPPLVRDLQLAEALRAEPGLFAAVLAAHPDAFEHELTGAEEGTQQLWGGLHSLKPYGSAAAPDAVAAAATTDLQAVRQHCADLWAMLKAGAQATWKEWAGQRSAELTPQLVGLKAQMEGHWARAHELVERLTHEHAAAAAHAQRAARELDEHEARHQAEKERRAKLSELRRQAAEATATHADRVARLAAARQQQESLAAERQRVDAAHASAAEKLEALRGQNGTGAAPGAESATELAVEAEDAMHKWDMLDITCGLAGWRLAAATPLESPGDSAGSCGARLTFRLAGGLAQLTVLLRAPGAAEGGSCSCLEVDEAAAGVPPQLRGLAATVIGADLMGTHMLTDASQAGIASLLDAAAAAAGRAADLLAEAAALRPALPRLAQLAWLPATAEEGRAAGGRLRLDFLCMATGARLRADFAVGPGFYQDTLDFHPHVSFPGTARISPAAVAEAAAAAASGAGRLTRIAAALSELAASAPAAAPPTEALSLSLPPQQSEAAMETLNSAEAQPDVAAAAVDCGAGFVADAAAQPAAADAGEPAAELAAPAADTDMVEAEDSQPTVAAAGLAAETGPEAAADAEMADAAAVDIGVDDEAADAEAAHDAAAASPAAAAATEQQLTQQLASPPTASSLWDAVAVAEDAANNDMTAADAMVAAPSSPTAAEGGTAEDAAPPSAEAGPAVSPAAAAIAAEGAAENADGGSEPAEGGNAAAGGKTPHATMSVISNPLYTSTQRT